MQEARPAGLTTTDVLAIIGAITGTVGTLLALAALLWDYYKWHLSEQVQLKVTAFPGFLMTTGDPNQEYISLTATNIGKIPTTIKLITLQGFEKKKDLKKRNGQRVSIVTPAYGQLPVQLKPGDDWTGGIYQDLSGIEEYYKYNLVFIQFEDTMSKTPIRAQLDIEKIKSSNQRSR